MTIEDMTEASEALAHQNQQKCAYLASVGVAVPQDELYIVSLLEYLVGDDDDVKEARAFHERRIAPILDVAIENTQKLAQQAQQAQAQAAEEQASNQRKAQLLSPLAVRPG